VFTRDLSFGDSGSDVKCLQQYLNSTGYTVAKTGAGSTGRETTYFGTKLRRAVSDWQKANALVPARGYFGPLSRAAYTALTTSSTTAPQIDQGTATSSPALSITNTRITDVTLTSAWLWWDTNKPATTQAYYSPAPYQYPGIERLASGTSTVHAIQLTGLQQNTAYDIIAVSRYVSSTTPHMYEYASSSIMRFSTSATSSPDTLRISNAQVSNVATQAATISWSTKKVASSKVFISPFPYVYPGTPWETPGLTKNHTVRVGNLQPSTTYSAIAVSDVTATTSPFAYEYASSSILYFQTTTATSSPDELRISNAQVMSMGSTKATVAWSTNKLSSTEVFFSPAPYQYPNTHLVGGNSVNHGIILNGLLSDTIYDVIAVSRSMSPLGIPYNEYASSSVMRFRTQVSTSSASITVTSPNGGEQYVRGNRYNLTWTTAPSASNSPVQLSLIATTSAMQTLVPLTTNTGSYSWRIPTTFHTGSYKLRVSDALIANTYDNSDNYFTVTMGTTTPTQPPPPPINNLPDVTIFGYKSPLTATPNQNVVLSVGIRNAGLASSSASQVRVALSARSTFYLPESVFSEAVLNVPALPASSREIEIAGTNIAWVNWSTQIPGNATSTTSTIYLIARADPNNTLLESNENNNESATQINIKPQTSSILTPEQLSFANKLATLGSVDEALRLLRQYLYSIGYSQ